MNIVINKIVLSFKKVLKYISIKIIEGVIVGIIAGVVVSYLFNIPTISLNGTIVKINKETIDIIFQYENKGNSPALEMTTKYLYGLDTQNPENFIYLNPPMTDKIEAGDVFSYTAPNLPLHKTDDNAILLSLVTYKDRDKLRQLINENLFHNSYNTYKWAGHCGNEKSLSSIAKINDDNYKKALIERISN